MSTVTKEFPTGDVLSVVTDRLVPSDGHKHPVDAIYSVLNWMTGESVYTHQIPRIGREAKKVILAMHPHLAEAVKEAEQVSGDNWREWRDRWINRYGPNIAAPKMTIAEHERIDPLSELSEMVHLDKIIVVQP